MLRRIQLPPPNETRFLDLTKPAELRRDDLDYLIKKLNRPSDHKRMRRFHFATCEFGQHVVLFNGLNEIVKVFKKTWNETHSFEFQEHEQVHLYSEIREFALNQFLDCKNEMQKIGGYLFN